jgi:hypothetical protein
MLRTPVSKKYVVTLHLSVTECGEEIDAPEQPPVFIHFLHRDPHRRNCRQLTQRIRIAQQRMVVSVAFLRPICNTLRGQAPFFGVLPSDLIDVRPESVLFFNGRPGNAAG